MSVLQEFKKFAMRGNVIDLAVGIIIGGAFGKITSSLVNDVLMPPIGLLLGKVNFNNLYVSLTGEEYESLALAKEAGAATINYGVFISTIIDFMFVAFAVFLLVKAINRLQEGNKKPEPPPAPNTKDCPFCLTAIPIKATKCGHCTSEVPA